MKQRNPKATCETCPYFTEWQESEHCRKQSPVVGVVRWPYTTKGEWCGEHPDFFGEETAKSVQEKGMDLLIDREWDRMREEYGQSKEPS